MAGLCVAVVGPGEDASVEAMEDARAVGRLIAERGWITLCGGRAAGVMGAVAAGAREADGLVIGILPGGGRGDAAAALTVALATGLGEARNAVLVTAADAVIGCGLNPGTASELALALRARKPTVLVRPTDEAAAFFAGLAAEAPLRVVGAPEEAIKWIAQETVSCASSRIAERRPND
jgi:uncharacterized protein (TIGR00725 family)